MVEFGWLVGWSVDWLLGWLVGRWFWLLGWLVVVSYLASCFVFLKLLSQWLG